MDGETRRRGDGRRGEYWTRLEMEELVAYARSGLTTLDIAKRMLRTTKSIRNKASQLGVSLAGRGKVGRPQALDAKVRRVMVGPDFDVSALTPDERRALATQLLQGLPAREVAIPDPYDPRAAGRARWEARHGTPGERERRRPKRSATTASEGPSRRQRRKEKRRAKLEAWYQRQLAPKPAADPAARTGPIPFDPFDEPIDFGPDSQPLRWSRGG